MELYHGSSESFIQDTTRNAIAGMLQTAYFDYYRREAPKGEAASWRNSLRLMKDALKDGNLLDHGVLLEYELPLSSLRLDCMVLGHDSAKMHPNAVIVELKQWEKCDPSDAENCVRTWVGGAHRDQEHPSMQAFSYADYLRNMHTAFADDRVILSSCAYLHNCTYDANDEIYGKKFTEVLGLAPSFAGDQQKQLIDYLRNRLDGGNGMPVLDAVRHSKFRPSKKLMSHVADIVDGQKVYVLLDSQRVVYERVLAEVRAATSRQRKKTIVLVRGGPGTGKSVVALKLLGDLNRAGVKTLHATGSSAFTSNLRKIVGRQASALLKYFHNFGKLAPNTLDCLILDEAHRIRKTSSLQYTKFADRTTKAQVRELADAAKVSVYFIDDLQVVRPKEVGSAELVRTTAKEVRAALVEFELEAQFRCGGSEGYINWIDNTLGIRDTANVIWKSTEKFDFRMVDSVEELEAQIRGLNTNGDTARLVAGYCWNWSKPDADGNLLADVQLGSWQMPWNAKPDAPFLAKGIPKSHYWAQDAGGIEQVGCVYTAQGFEFDYVGVIFGTDLRYDPDRGQWIADKRRSHDRTVKQAKTEVEFLALVKSTYRVLLTRGMKGCLVYFMDAETRKFFRSRMK
jgi:uncharacterized protein